MVIKDLYNTDLPIEIISNIRESLDPLDIKKLREQWNVSEHKIMDKVYLPDKQIKNAKGEIQRTKKVNRIALPYQKLIVNRLVSFGFANPVTLDSNATEDTNAQMLVDAIEGVRHGVKESTLNKQVARDLYRATQVAELWYFVKGETHNDYGFPTEFKLKCLKLSPWDGDELYPIFDDYGDMVAFAREFEFSGNVTMDVWTATERRRYIETDSGWSEEKIDSVLFGKIPIIFSTQEQAEWTDVMTLIERLELVLSRHAEVNDYNSAPKTFVKGKVASLPQAGEANPVLQGDKDSDIKILSWESAPESVKLEIENLIENIHKFTQIPDISFNSIKGLSQVSGVMLKMLFTDTYLKILEKNEIWEEHFQRRYNLVRAMLSHIQPSFKDLDLQITPMVNPYELEDDKTKIDMLLNASGNKAFLSRRTALELSGMVVDVGQELEQLMEQEELEANRDIFNPTNL